MAKLRTNQLPDTRVFDLMVDATQEEDLFNQPSSTAVSIEKELFAKQQFEKDLMSMPYEHVKGTKVEKAWLDVQSELHGAVSKEKRSTIQRKADEFYQSGPIGATAAAAADILPGLPGIDIIDPPEQLTGKGMESARGILGALGTVGAMYKTPQVIGRVATNIREPYGYGKTFGRIIANTDVPMRRQNITHLTKHLPPKLREAKSKAINIYDRLKKAARSIATDEPLYIQGPGAKGYYTAADDAREFLYRRTFGLKPRAGKNIFKENKDGTLSFNPKSKRGKTLIKEMMASRQQQHSVMGGYKRGVTRKEKTFKAHPLDRGEITKIDYEDVWDFKLHPHEWSKLFNQPSPARATEAALRTLVDLTTKPPHIKGTIDLSGTRYLEGRPTW